MSSSPSLFFFCNHTSHLLASRNLPYCCKRVSNDHLSKQDLACTCTTLDHPKEASVLFFFFYHSLLSLWREFFCLKFLFLIFLASAAFLSLSQATLAPPRLLLQCTSFLSTHRKDSEGRALLGLSLHSSGFPPDFPYLWGRTIGFFLLGCLTVFSSLSSFSIPHSSLFFFIRSCFSPTWGTPERQRSFLLYFSTSLFSWESILPFLFIAPHLLRRLSRVYIHLLTFMQMRSGVCTPDHSFWFPLNLSVGCLYTRDYRPFFSVYFFSSAPRHNGSEFYWVRWSSSFNRRFLYPSAGCRSACVFQRASQYW